MRGDTVLGKSLTDGGTAETNLTSIYEYYLLPIKKVLFPSRSHGVCNPHTPLQSKYPNKSSSITIIPLSSISPLTFTASLGLGGVIYYGTAWSQLKFNHIKQPLYLQKKLNPNYYYIELYTTNIMGE
jgi:hypothetical protein